MSKGMVLWKILTRPTSGTHFRDMHPDFSRGFWFFISAYSPSVTSAPMSVIDQILQLCGCSASLAAKSSPWPCTAKTLTLDLSACGLRLLPLTLSDKPLSDGLSSMWIADAQNMPFPLLWELSRMFSPLCSPLHSLQALALFCVHSGWSLAWTPQPGLSTEPSRCPSSLPPSLKPISYPVLFFILRDTRQPGPISPFSQHLQPTLTPWQVTSSPISPKDCVPCAGGTPPSP